MKIQWLGHSAFKIIGEKTSVLIDPFLTDNPKFTGTLEQAGDGVSHILLTHAHNDHFGDTIELIKQTGATLVAMVELANHVKASLPDANVVGLNFGGSYETEDGLLVSLVPAWHSSTLTQPDGSTVYGGLPAGIVLGMDGHSIYHMGDTTVFSDMALINELYDPDIGLVPIGGHFTMDAKMAAMAVNRYFNFLTVIPCHYMTFPLLAQSADAFAEAIETAEVLTPMPMEEVEV